MFKYFYLLVLHCITQRSIFIHCWGKQKHIHVSVMKLQLSTTAVHNQNPKHVTKTEHFWYHWKAYQVNCQDSKKVRVLHSIYDNVTIVKDQTTLNFLK